MKIEFSLMFSQESAAGSYFCSVEPLTSYLIRNIVLRNTKRIFNHCEPIFVLIVSFQKWFLGSVCWLRHSSSLRRRLHLHKAECRFVPRTLPKTYSELSIDFAVHPEWPLETLWYRTDQDSNLYRPYQSGVTPSLRICINNVNLTAVVA